MRYAVLSVFFAFAGLAAAGETPAAAPTNAAPALSSAPHPIFQPVTLDPALVRRSMQARSELDQLNRRIQDRQAQLYAENERIRELQTQLRELQAEIDALMDRDEELQRLRKEYQAITPDVPMGPPPFSATSAPPAAAP